MAATLEDGVKVYTANEMLRMKRLDWEVGLEALQIASNGAAVEGYKAVVRKDNGFQLGIVEGRYKPYQTRTAFEAFDQTIGKGLAFYENAGSIGGGKRVWIQARLPGDIVIKKNDRILKRLLLAMGHDGGFAIKFGPTPERTACWNAVQSALREKDNFISLRHTGDIEGRVAEAFRVVGLMEQRYAELAVFFETLASRPLFGEGERKVVEDIFPAGPDGEVSTRLKNIRSLVHERIESGKGTEIPGVKGTAWGVWNGVIEYLDHFRVQKGGDTLSADEMESRRRDNIWFGPVAQVRERATRVIAEAVGIAL